MEQNFTVFPRLTPVDLVQFVWWLVKEKKLTMQELLKDFQETAHIDQGECKVNCMNPRALIILLKSDNPP